MKDTEFGIPSNNWKQIVQLLELGRSNEVFCILDAEIVMASDNFFKSAAYEKLGAIYRTLNKPEKAIEAFQEAIKLHGSLNTPALTRIYLALGLTYKETGNVQKALEIYEMGINKLFDRAIKLIADEEGCFSSTNDKGERVLNVSPKAFERIRELCKMDVTFAALRNNMGTCFVELGDYDTARQMFSESIDFTPDGLSYDHPRYNLSCIDS
jgi:tetratricopeptide (TPR) repeat protein